MSPAIEKLKESIARQPGRIPRHIAIIMDGNGRWAAMRNKPRTFGHEAGVKAVREVVKAASEIGVKYLTLYTFSSENWKRPRSEVAALMSLLSRTTRSELNDLIKNDVKLITIGRIDGLSESRRRVLTKAVERTRDNNGLVLILALNYGGRTEILDAVKAIANSARSGLIDLNEITEELFSDFLYTVDIPDPDLMIRTSGEKRISNFLLWQTSYTELYIIDMLWPDFGRRELFQAVADYQIRERRFGKVTTKAGHE
ncbi:MAG: isoprenyl transferase [candidate division Zixibacteria bacterium]|nr:isoprenyl transferase [candidate division Zixibacteria bacterium]